MSHTGSKWLLAVRWRVERHSVTGESRENYWNRLQIDIFKNLLGLGLGLITGQKKGPAQPEGRSRTGKYLEGA